jgi:excisionase family DNA binding protein
MHALSPVADEFVPSARAVIDRLAYSPDEAARKLGCSRQMIYNFMTSGQLASVKLGRSRKVMHADLVALLEANRTGGPR